MTKHKHHEDDVEPGHNLVQRPTFRPWNTGPDDPWENIGRRGYCNAEEEGDIDLIYLTGQGAVAQTVTLPITVELGSTYPFYRLKFDFKVEGSPEDPALILHYLTEGELARDPFRIPLTSGRDGQQVSTWTLFSCQIPLEPGETELKVEFYGGSHDKGNKGLKVTAVDVQLVLAELEIDSLYLDETQVSLDAPLLLSHGQKRRLRVVPKANSQWLALPSALRWKSESPKDAFGLTFTPDLEQFTETPGWVWEIACSPYEPSQARGLFELGLVSYYSARPFPLTFELGDHHFTLAEQDSEGGSPIIDEGHAVTLKARVRALFDVRWLEAVNVSWFVRREGGEEAPVAKIASDDRGWSSYCFLPKEAGQYQVRAVVSSADGPPSEQSFQVTAYPSSPWLSKVSLVVDNEPFAPKGDVLVLPRGFARTLKLQPEVGNPLIGTLLTLSAQPGLGSLEIEPAEPTCLPESGLQWRVEVGSENPQGLALLLTSVAFGTPLSLNAAVVSGELADETVALMVNEELLDLKHLPLIRALPGKKLRLHFKPSAALAKSGAALHHTGELKLSAEPAFDEPQSLSSDGAVWEIDASEAPQGGAFCLMIDVPPVPEPLVLQGLWLPDRLDASFDALAFDGEPLDPTPVGIVMTRGQQHHLTVTPAAVLQGMAVSITVPSEAPLDLRVEPDGAVELEAGENEWRLQGGATDSGRFDLTVQCDWGALPMTLEGRLLSADLSDDLDQVDDSPVDQGKPLIVLKGVNRVLSVIPDAALAGLPLVLCQEEGQALTSTPALGDYQPVPGEGAEWSLHAPMDSESGGFSLALNRAEGVTPHRLAGRVLSVEVSAEVETIELDKLGIDVGQSLLLQREREYQLKIVPTAALAGLSVCLNLDDAQHVNMTATPAFGAPCVIEEQGQTWTIKTHEGEAMPFNMLLRTEVESQQPLKIAGHVLSSVLADEVDRIRVKPLGASQYDTSADIGLILLGHVYHDIEVFLRSGSLLTARLACLQLRDDNALPEKEKLSITPKTALALQVKPEDAWEVFYGEKRLSESQALMWEGKFNLELASDNFVYQLPCRLFSDPLYLQRQCEFSINEKPVKPGDDGDIGKAPRLSSRLTLSLSEPVREHLAGLSLTLMTVEASVEATPPLNEPVIVTHESEAVTWTFTHQVQIEKMFKVEVKLFNHIWISSTVTLQSS